MLDPLLMTSVAGCLRMTQPGILCLARRVPNRYCLSFRCDCRRRRQHHWHCPRWECTAVPL